MEHQVVRVPGEVDVEGCVLVEGVAHEVVEVEAFAVELPGEEARVGRDSRRRILEGVLDVVVVVAVAGRWFVHAVRGASLLHVARLSVVAAMRGDPAEVAVEALVVAFASVFALVVMAQGRFWHPA